MKKLKWVTVFYLLVNVLFLTGCTLQDVFKKDPTLLTRNDIPDILYYVINWSIEGAGIFAIVFIIIGGIQYITSSGNEESSKKAKATLTWAIVGFILVLAAYMIVRFIYSTFTGNKGFI